MFLFLTLHFSLRLFLLWLRGRFWISWQAAAVVISIQPCIDVRAGGDRSIVKPTSEPSTKDEEQTHTLFFFLSSYLFVFVYTFRNNQGFYCRKRGAHLVPDIPPALLWLPPVMVQLLVKINFNFPYFAFARQNVYLDDNKTFVKETHLSS